jgi:hypothetical protein
LAVEYNLGEPAGISRELLLEYQILPGILIIFAFQIRVTKSARRAMKWLD